MRRFSSNSLIFSAWRSDVSYTHLDVYKRQDLVERHVLLQLDGQRLAMAAHGTDAHAQAIDGDRARGTEGRTAEDLVEMCIRDSRLARAP